MSKLTIKLDGTEISESGNAGRKSRARRRRADKIAGDRLASTPARVTRAHHALKHREPDRKVTRVDVAGKPVENEFAIREVSMSSDVIFSPNTQTTRYSASREAKRNLERRMPGYLVDVVYASGEGLLRFLTKSNFVLTDGDYSREVMVAAECVASQSDMSIRNVEVFCDGRAFNIEPADRAMFPEDAVKVLSRIAENCVRSM